jgi:hypothetical protein
LLYVSLSEIKLRAMKKKFTHIKKPALILLLTAFLVQGFGQKTSAAGDPTVKDPDAADSTEVIKIIVGKERLIIQDDNEAVNVKIGNRGLTILESLEAGERRVRIEKYEPKKTDDLKYADRSRFYEDTESDKAKRRSRFKGHWAGIEFGFNNYLTADNTLTLPESIDYMSLHSGKSHNFNFNVAQTSVGLARRIGFVTGLGINWNNYRFDKNNNIIKGENGVIEKYDPEMMLKKSKFSTLFLTLPVLLEFQIPADHNHLNIAAGPVGGVKLYSYSKMVFEENDKVKSEDDFSLNLLRYGATARIGYKNVQVYGTYWFTPLFKTGKSPGGIELYPFEIGIAFTID